MVAVTMAMRQLCGEWESLSLGTPELPVQLSDINPISGAGFTIVSSLPLSVCVARWLP